MECTGQDVDQGLLLAFLRKALWEMRGILRDIERRGAQGAGEIVPFYKRESADVRVLERIFTEKGWKEDLQHLLTEDESLLLRTVMGEHKEKGMHFGASGDQGGRRESGNGREMGLKMKEERESSAVERTLGESRGHGNGGEEKE